MAACLGLLAHSPAHSVELQPSSGQVLVVFQLPGVVSAGRIETEVVGSRTLRLAAGPGPDDSSSASPRYAVAVDLPADVDPASCRVIFKRRTSCLTFTASVVGTAPSAADGGLGGAVPGAEGGAAGARGSTAGAEAACEGHGGGPVAVSNGQNACASQMPGGPGTSHHAAPCSATSLPPVAAAAAAAPSAPAGGTATPAAHTATTTAAPPSLPSRSTSDGDPLVPQPARAPIRLAQQHPAAMAVLPPSPPCSPGAESLDDVALFRNFYEDMPPTPPPRATDTTVTAAAAGQAESEVAAASAPAAPAAEAAGGAKGAPAALAVGPPASSGEQQASGGGCSSSHQQAVGAVPEVPPVQVAGTRSAAAEAAAVAAEPAGELSASAGRGDAGSPPNGSSNSSGFGTPPASPSPPAAVARTAAATTLTATATAAGHAAVAVAPDHALPAGGESGQGVAGAPVSPPAGSSARLHAAPKAQQLAQALLLRQEAAAAPAAAPAEDHAAPPPIDCRYIAVANSLNLAAAFSGAPAGSAAARQQQERRVGEVLGRAAATLEREGYVILDSYIPEGRVRSAYCCTCTAAERALLCLPPA